MWINSESIGCIHVTRDGCPQRHPDWGCYEDEELYWDRWEECQRQASESNPDAGEAVEQIPF